LINKSLLITYSKASLAMLFWSLSFVWVKLAYNTYKPLTVVFIRLLIASVLLISLSLIVRKLQRISRKDLPVFILMAFCEPFCYFLGESFGMQLVSASLGALLISLIPVISPLFAFLFLKERVGYLEILGLVLSFAGVSLIMVNQWDSHASLKGLLLMLFAVLSGIGYSLFVRKLTNRYTILSIVTWQSIIGMLLFLPLFLMFEIPTLQYTQFDLSAFQAILALSIFASCGSFLLFTSVIKKIGVVRSNSFTNLIPVLTATFSYFILKESLSTVNVLGILLTISGLYLSQLLRDPIAPITKKDSVI